MKTVICALAAALCIPALGQAKEAAPKYDFSLDAKPEPVAPQAKGMDLVDGAIVCPSMDEANWLYSRINAARHARQSLSPDLRRQGALLNGYDYGAEPRPSDYQCQFVPAGTPMNVRMEMGVIPVVSGKLKDGRPFAGVTIPNMVEH